MKRNFYYLFMVLFILAGCAQPSAEMQTATASQEITVTATPTERPTATPTEKPQETSIINNEYLSDYSLEYKGYSRVSLEDILSGKTLAAETKWLEEHPFSPEAIPITGKYSIDTAEGELFSISIMKEQIVYFEPDPSDWENYKDPDKRPIKAISYYVLWDEKLLDEFGRDLISSDLNQRYDEYHTSNLGIVAWAWLNPDRTTVIGHSLVDLTDFGEFYIDEQIRVKEGYKKILDADMIWYPSCFSSVTDLKRPKEIFRTPALALAHIYTKYPESSPKELCKKWISTKIMPKELSTKLFGFTSAIQSGWWR